MIYVFSQFCKITWQYKNCLESLLISFLLVFHLQLCVTLCIIFEDFLVHYFSLWLTLTNTAFCSSGLSIGGSGYDAERDTATAFWSASSASHSGFLSTCRHLVPASDVGDMETSHPGLGRFQLWWTFTQIRKKIFF